MSISQKEFSELAFNEPAIALVMITPDVAQEILDTRNYELQRPIKRKVSQYIADMKSAKWRSSMADPILFTKEGKLINGQHRLMAVVRSGTCQLFYVGTGADETEFKNIDIGIGRTAADGLNGLVKNTKGVCAIARKMLNIIRGYGIDTHSGTTNVVTNNDVHEYVLSRDEHLQELFNIGQRMRNSLKVRGFGCNAFCIAFWLMRVRDEHVANEYLEAFCSGDHNLMLVRETILRKAISKDRKAGQWLIETLLQSFNGFLRGAPTKSFNKGPATYKRYAELTRTHIGWWS